MELFFRSLAPPATRAAQETITDRLKRLDDRGHIREYELTVWGSCIRLDTTPRTPTEEALRDKKAQVSGSFAAGPCECGAAAAPETECSRESGVRSAFAALNRFARILLSSTARSAGQSSQ